jgi:hypothetical protein
MVGPAFNGGNLLQIQLKLEQCKIGLDNIAIGYDKDFDEVHFYSLKLNEQISAH